MRFFGDGWGIEIRIAPYIPLRRIFINGKITGARNLITNFRL